MTGTVTGSVAGSVSVPVSAAVPGSVTVTVAGSVTGSVSVIGSVPVPLIVTVSEPGTAPQAGEPRGAAGLARRVEPPPGAPFPRLPALPPVHPHWHGRAFPATTPPWA